MCTRGILIRSSCSLNIVNIKVLCPNLVRTRVSLNTINCFDNHRNYSTENVNVIGNLKLKSTGKLPSHSQPDCRKFLNSSTVKMGHVGNFDSTILLFDVDGTLTKSRQLIEPEMYNFLINEVKPKVKIGLVGGSDFEKIAEQMGGEKVVDQLDYVFSENGLVAHQNGKLIGSESIQKYIGEQKLQKFINFCLGYMSKLELPVKRGTFIEFRKGMINVCPVGRSCTQEERDQFFEFDQINNVRENFVQALKTEFPDLGLKFSIGGQISLDAFPIGWDKTFCLKYLLKFSNIHFFGDKTAAGGNDHEIYEDSRTIGHAVNNPQDTMEQVKKVLLTLSS